MSGMATHLEKNPRLLVLIVGLILVAGGVALTLLPRTEDPRLTPRAARLITVLPGADAERIESLVTEKLEAAIQEIEEVKELSSISSTNASVVVVELADDVDEVEAENAWAQIRDKAEDAKLKMPAETIAPELKTIDSANALILALKWDLEAPPNFAILVRLIKDLQDKIDRIPGTEKSELFGAPAEEILVTVDPDAMTALGLSPLDISKAIASSDSKVSAGLLRTGQDNVLIEVSGQLDTLLRVGQIPVQYGDGSNFVQLADVAEIQKTVKTPTEAEVLLQNRTAVALGVQIHPSTRIDLWSRDADRVLAAFHQQLPSGIELQKVFEQRSYVSARMNSLAFSLLCGVLAITAVMLVIMGLRAALIVGVTLPLVSLLVVAIMHWLGIPIHQMSITGLIIAMGLMIDNAIVVVDEIAQRLRTGYSRSESVTKSCDFLWMPLLGSTVTTVLSFSPIILMEGPTGEFVGSIAVVAALAVLCSLGLAMTVVATLAGLGLPAPQQAGWASRGLLSSPSLIQAYRQSIAVLLRFPRVSIAAVMLVPIAGFLAGLSLPEQFFPPAERNQFQIELELPATTSIAQTKRRAQQIREFLVADPRIADVKWFLGESALMFYYNVIPLRTNVPQYGQAIVECQHGTDVRRLLLELQSVVDARFPDATVLLRQLQQGPPYEAPIEIRLSGPDITRLRELGDQVRLTLTEIPPVHHTRAGFSESLPKLSFVVDEQQARLGGFDPVAIADELDSHLEGITGGSLVESTEELPVRVRVSGENRQDLAAIQSFDLLAPQQTDSEEDFSDYRGVPLSAISDTKLVSETVRISRRNGERVNEVHAFINADVLPSSVLAEFKRRWRDSGNSIPPGYSISYGGAESERDDAVRELIGNVFVIVFLMIATMVISLRSFRYAALLFLVAGLSVGFSLGALSLVGYPWGFMSMVAMMGMIGVAVNDSIVVLAAIRELPPEDLGLDQIAERVVASTRHVISTTMTTLFGFTPLFLFGGEFWSPVAVVISGGVGGATLLALVLMPCSYIVLDRSRGGIRGTTER